MSDVRHIAVFRVYGWVCRIYPTAVINVTPGKGLRVCYLAMNLVWLAEPSAWISVRITTVPGAGVRMVRPERSV